MYLAAIKIPINMTEFSAIPNIKNAGISIKSVTNLTKIKMKSMGALLRAYATRKATPTAIFLAE